MFLIKIFIFLTLSAFYLTAAVRHEEYLDFDEKYFLAWEYDEATDEITFEAIVETIGWVGLGLNPSAGMIGADIVIGGVDDQNLTYFSDRHGVAWALPPVDDKTDWILLDASQIEGKTSLKMKRKLDTCDAEHDIAITEDLLYILWSYGETDELLQHIERGQVQFNLLDAPNPPVETDKFIPYKIRLESPEIELPQETVYWVNYRKIDVFQGYENPLYLVGFDPSPVRSSIESEEHTHHFSVARCMTPDPDHALEIFEPLLDHPGWHSGEDIPGREYCSAYFYAWAKGGKMLLFPEKLGFTMGDLGTIKTEYIMIEVHHDNPGLKEMNFTTGFDIFYSQENRGNEAGLIGMGLDVNPTHFVPPLTAEYKSNAHCSSACTANYFPEGGVKIFNVLLHSHLAGRKLKIRHFRGNQELPWLSYDNNYNFDFQQNRNLRNEIEVLPGDHLTIECSYDTTNRPNVTLSGEGTFEEMCQAYIWYYPKQDLDVCASRYFDAEKMFGRFGIEEFELGSDYYYYDPIISLPEGLQGKRWSEVLNAQNWTDELKQEIEKMHLYDLHEDLCLGRDGSQKSLLTWNNKVIKKFQEDSTRKSSTKYPDIEEEYKLPNYCFPEDENEFWSSTSWPSMSTDSPDEASMSTDTPDDGDGGSSTTVENPTTQKAGVPSIKNSTSLFTLILIFNYFIYWKF